MNNPRPVSDYRYVSQFLGSFLFIMQMLYPLRYLVHPELPEQGPTPILEMLFLCKRVRDNLRQLAPGEGQEFVTLVAEDTRRHFGIPYSDNKERVKTVQRLLEVSESAEDFLRGGRIDKFLEEVKKLGLK